LDDFIRFYLHVGFNGGQHEIATDSHLDHLALIVTHFIKFILYLITQLLHLTEAFLDPNFPFF